MSDFQNSQSTHNKQTSDFLNSATPKYRDWEIITLFYSALHRIDKYFLDNGIQKPNNHAERKSLVRRHLPVIYGSYHKLSTLGHRARYIVGINIPQNELGQAQNHYSVIDTNIP